MNWDFLFTWLYRYGHVLGGAIWVGGYFLMALIVVPALRRTQSEAPTPALFSFAINAVRIMTYTGVATIYFGTLLITRTRGFGSLLRGEWGLLVISSAVIAVVLLGIGDGALRPALRRMAQPGGAFTEEGRRAQRYAYIGLALTILAVGLMTRTLYALS
jgi:putative copper export protein